MFDPAAAAAIERLVHQHAWLIDHGRAGEVADLFTRDARLLGVGPDKIGRAAIADWARERAATSGRRSRHAQSNILIEMASEHEARGTVLLTLYRHDGEGAGPAAPLLIGEYADHYRKEADAVWRFAERRLSVLFGAG